MNFHKIKMNENKKCCDNCTHYHWYYDYCDKWKCEVDAREVHDCFKSRLEIGNGPNNTSA